jgi:GNAT superfamily N-acetyltransferase
VLCELRAFEPKDRHACLALFDDNCPEFFAANERADYAAFLDAAPQSYRVGVTADGIVAAFGLRHDIDPERCRLTWILIAAAWQGRGIGRRIMAEVTELGKAAGAPCIDIAASHKSAPFFARFGATAVRQQRDGWGPGMHRVDMELWLSTPCHESVSAPGPILESRGGRIVIPDLVLIGRLDGGHLVVDPPRPVWERSELTTRELTDWSILVAATGRAMLDALPQLAGGCINYWEAGNWALNDQAEPEGPKDPREHRRVHMHLFGRSRNALHDSWRWGEAPRFPSFVERREWAQPFQPLTRDECTAIVAKVRAVLPDA